MTDLTTLELFLFTAAEYKRFSDYYNLPSDHSIYEGFTQRDYIGIQTKLIILRKYGSNKDPVFLETVLNAAEREYPQYFSVFKTLREEFNSIQQDGMQTFLSDGKEKSLFSLIEDVMYGMYLHADKLKIDDLSKIDKVLLFSATRKYVEGLEKVVLTTFEQLQPLVQTGNQNITFNKAPVISVENVNSDIQGITGSPYWSNIFGKDATDEETRNILSNNSLEDNYIILLCASFLEEARKDDFSANELRKMVFPPTYKDWGSFEKIHTEIKKAKDIGWSTRVRYNDKHDMAYVHIFQNVKGAFTIDHPHVISQDIAVITLVNERKYGWKIFSIGERVTQYKESLSLGESIRRLLKRK